MSTNPAEPTNPVRADVARSTHPVAPPPSSGGTKALIGVLLAGMAGMVFFLFVHLSKDGGIRTGPAPAHAECTKGARD